tara:strand:- start:2043 stop:2459 length:417 start_codon:yes stop_codon:yes gene_type:complete
MRFDDGQCELRARFLNETLTERGWSSTGRQARIRKLTGASPQVSQAILRGSLPKRGATLYGIARALDIDLDEWISGEQSGRITIKDMRYAIDLVRQFEFETDIQWSSEDFTGQVEKVLHDPVYMRRHIADVVALHRKK